MFVKVCFVHKCTPAHDWCVRISVGNIYNDVQFDTVGLKVCVKQCL